MAVLAPQKGLADSLESTSCYDPLRVNDPLTAKGEFTWGNLSAGGIGWTNHLFAVRRQELIISGTGHSIVKGTPLGELLTNWSKIDGARGLSKKRALELRQDTWPALTTLGIARVA